MRKNRSLFLLLCGAVLLAGCGGGKKPASESLGAVETVVAGDFPDTLFWSTWTPEQRRVNIALGEFSVQHLKLVGKRFVMEASRADFAKAGLADSIYENVLLGLEETNKRLDTLPLEQVQKQYEEFITPMRQLFGNDRE